MKVMGIRCSNSDCTFCILTGTRDAPVVNATDQVVFPKGYSEPELHKWFHQEMSDVFGKHKCDAVGIKRAETNVKRSNSLEARIQNDAIVSLAAVEAGCLSVYRKVNCTIAKDLGLKGKSKYLKTMLDTAPIVAFDKYPAKIQEAILTGWSCM